MDFWSEFHNLYPTESNEISVELGGKLSRTIWNLDRKRFREREEKLKQKEEDLKEREEVLERKEKHIEEMNDIISLEETEVKDIKYRLNKMYEKIELEEWRKTKRKRDEDIDKKDGKEDEKKDVKK
jgi:hypothetical protein